MTERAAQTEGTQTQGTQPASTAEAALADPASPRATGEARTTGTAQTAIAPSRRGRGLKSARDMVISLAVIAVPIAFIVTIYPHHDSNPVHVVSYATDLRQVTTLAPFPVQAPEGLSPMWRPTSDDYSAPSQDDATWHIGFVTPAGKYAALEQTSGAAQPLLDADAAGVSPDGSVSIDGITWRRYTGGGHNALVRSVGPHDTVVLAGSAGLPELREFAASLRVHAAPATATP